MRTLFLTLVIWILGSIAAFAAEVDCNPAKVDATFDGPAKGDAALQDGTKSTPVVGGTYEPMSWWTSFRISNSFYTNPEALKEINFAYLYAPSQVTDDQRRLEEVYKAAAAGKMLMAVSKDKSTGIDGGVTLVSLDDPSIKTAAGTITDPKSFKTYLDTHDVYLASSGNEFCGSVAKAVFVKARRTSGK
jgi:hypothetical protein